MAFEQTDTETASKFKKILVYGPSGVGKTKLTATLPKPVIISSEKKFESLSGIKIPVLRISTSEDLKDALNEVMNKKKWKGYDVVIDSLTDISETALSFELPNHKDPRKAHGVIQLEFQEILRTIRDTDKRNMYVIAQIRRYENDEGEDQYMPKMTGQQLGPNLAYYFDYVFAMRISKATDESKSYRYLQTDIEFDPRYVVKDSSGLLDKIEKPDLGRILKKIGKNK